MFEQSPTRQSSAGNSQFVGAPHGDVAGLLPLINHPALIMDSRESHLLQALALLVPCMLLVLQFIVGETGLLFI